MKKNNKNVLIIAVLLVIAVVFITQSKLLSIGIGGSPSYKYIYINTYDYPSMIQQPATVKYSFIGNDGISASGSCFTTISLFNPQIYLSELDAPVSVNPYIPSPINQLYASPSSTHQGQGNLISFCLITLPAQQLNNTLGTLQLLAVATNGNSSNVYTASLNIQSIYTATTQGQVNPVFITLPLTNNISTTSTTSTTTTTIPTSFITQLTTQQTTTFITEPTTTVIPPTPPPFSLSGLINSIITAINNFLSQYFSI